ncbi:MAG: SNF2-related protein [Planctomycetota bacterium]
MSARKQQKQQRRKVEIRRRRLEHEAHGRAAEHFLFARDAFEHGDAPLAIALCEKTLRVDPSFADAHLILASLLVPIDAARAAAHTRRYLEHTGTPDARLLVDLAHAFADAGDSELAAQLVQIMQGHGGNRWFRPRRLLTATPAIAASRRRTAGRIARAPAREPPHPAPELPVAPPVPSPPAPVAGSVPTIEQLPLRFEFDFAEVVRVLEQSHYDSPDDHALRLAAERLALFDGFDALLALDGLQGVTHMRHQIETVRKVLCSYRGRALLADEVGLGKTIEAGLVLKEYVLRGLAERVLILVPPSLVGQWLGELRDKFGLDFETTDSALYRSDAEAFFGTQARILASLDTAKSERNQRLLAALEFDLVIVDEAHRLRRRTSAAWRLVDALRSRYLLLLTATPIQNDLLELYSLVTLLKPGHLKTPAQFKRDYVERGDPCSPRQREKLRQLLGEVMVRNTRATVDIALPPRHAETRCVQPTIEERQLYCDLTAFVRQQFAMQGSLDRFTLHILQREAASSPQALVSTLRALGEPGRLPAPAESMRARLEAMASALHSSRKAQALLQIAREHGEKLVVFTEFRATLDFLARQLESAGVPFAVFHGGLTRLEKEQSVLRFEREADLLLSSEMGSEGRNLQVASAIVNYDIPWNPMRIEQRIGRVHRIGQTRRVAIYNLAATGTVEDHLLTILDRKINLFELVIGELDMILGNLRDEREFSEQVLDAWAGNPDDRAAGEALDRLGEDLVQARRAYDRTKALDRALFAEDFES